MHYLVGLGNPGEEYENTRHNTGRMFVEFFCKKQRFADFSFDKKTNSLKSEGNLKKEKIICLLPETFMNKSGSALKNVITSKKAAGKLILAHDDLDLPLGTYKISFGKGSAGHRGVESVIRAVKTKNFYRVRFGISPATPKGKIKKPPRQGSGQAKEKKILDFLMGKFKPKEMIVLKKVIKEAGGEVEKLIFNTQ